MARTAEELGYTDLWSFESNGLDAFTPLAAAAAATREVRLGTAIVPVFTRPPALIAMHAAALAELAPSRFVLGLGASTPALVESGMGVPFERPLARVREATAAVRGLLEGGRTGIFKLGRPPVETVPVYLAALGPAMLRLAGEIADGVVFFMAGPRIMPELVAALGREMDTVARLVAIPAPDRATALPFARRLITSYATVPFYARFLARQGFEEEVNAVNRLWDSGDRAAAAGQVSDAMAAELVVMGDAGEIGGGIEAYRRAGLTTPVVAFGLLSADARGRAEEARRLLVDLRRAA